jgi:hypothetical protein
MSAPITEAHRKLACDVLLDHSVSGAATKDGVIAAAQWIADSEARAVEAADFALQQERNIHMTTIAERDQAIARAARAEASLHALRLVCGTTDADKFSTWVNRANARAARAEAELAAERARLDWLEKRGPWESWNGFMETGITLRENIRAGIDAAMKEGAK